MIGRLPAVVGLLVVACGSPDWAPATAQRANYATDSVTTPDGTFETETGVASDPGHFVDTPVALKYGWSERTEIFAMQSPYVSVREDGDTVRGRSDTQLGWRHRFFEGDDRVAGVQLLTCVPTGSETKGLSSGETDFLLSAILDGVESGWAWTLFYELGWLGDPDDSGRHGQHALSVVLGTPVADQLDGFVEVFGIWNRHDSSNAVTASAGVAWNASPVLVVDVGVQTGLNDDADDTQVVFGVTRNFGRLFGRDP